MGAGQVPYYFLMTFGSLFPMKKYIPSCRKSQKHLHNVSLLHIPWYLCDITTLTYITFIKCFNIYQCREYIYIGKYQSIKTSYWCAIINQLFYFVFWLWNFNFSDHHPLFSENKHISFQVLGSQKLYDCMIYTVYVYYIRNPSTPFHAPYA